jgi:prepilin-type N-terminal cleavage/methylation domain-containing protein
MVLLGMKKFKNTSNGFTLLELLICLAVIGIVGAITIPNLSSWTNSRTIKKELTSLEALIDYGKVVSVNKSRKLLLNQTGTGAIQIFQLNDNIEALESENLNTTTCNFTSAFSAVNEYPNVLTFESTLMAQHTPSGGAGSAGSYPNATSIMCFFADGSTSGGGFLIEKNCLQYRVDVWLTGFYNKQVNTNNTCSGTATWIDRN